MDVAISRYGCGLYPGMDVGQAAGMTIDLAAGVGEGAGASVGGLTCYDPCCQGKLMREALGPISTLVLQTTIFQPIDSYFSFQTFSDVYFVKPQLMFEDYS